MGHVPRPGRPSSSGSVRCVPGPARAVGPRATGSEVCWRFVVLGSLSGTRRFFTLTEAEEKQGT